MAGTSFLPVSLAAFVAGTSLSRATNAGAEKRIAAAAFLAGTSLSHATNAGAKMRIAGTFLAGTSLSPPTTNTGAEKRIAAATILAGTSLSPATTNAGAKMRIAGIFLAGTSQSPPTTNAGAEKRIAAATFLAGTSLSPATTNAGAKMRITGTFLAGTSLSPPTTNAGAEKRIAAATLLAGTSLSRAANAGKAEKRIIAATFLAGTAFCPGTSIGAKKGRSVGGGKMESMAGASEEEEEKSDVKRKLRSPKNAVLVTGGAGFIGSHVAAALLTRGDRVVVVDELNDAYDPKRKEANLKWLAEIAPEGGGLCVVKADVADSAEMERLFDEQAIDMVCHLAARAGVRASLAYPDQYVRANMVGTTVLLDRAVKSGCSNFVYASSSSVYGERPPPRTMTESPAPTPTPTSIFEQFREHLSFKEDDAADAPKSPYAVTKRAAEMMARVYHEVYGLHTTGLRFFTVYGPRGRPDMAPFKFIDRICRGQPIERYGDGSSWRDYTFVDDVVDGILSALDRPFGCEIFNLGAGHPILLSRFIEAVEEVVGKKATIVEKPEQPGDVSGTFADISKASRLLNYNPVVAIEDGLQQTYSWYCECRQHLPQ